MNNKDIKHECNGTISTGVKIPPYRSAPVRREGKCDAAKHGAEFPYRRPQPETTSEPEVALTGCDVPSLNRSTSRIMTVGVIMVGMVGNALLCDRGRSHNVLLEAENKPYMFLGQWIQWKRYEVAEV